MFDLMFEVTLRNYTNKELFTLFIYYVKYIFIVVYNVHGSANDKRSISEILHIDTHSCRQRYVYAYHIYIPNMYSTTVYIIN